jgi:hypothetical protein
MQPGGVCFVLNERFSMDKKRYSYSAYGLNIMSDIELPDLVNSVTGCDVDISFKQFSKAEMDASLLGAVRFDRPGCVVRVAERITGYSWQGIADVLIRNGNEVIISTAPGVDDNDMAPFITGAILGNLLDQRGFLVLHGSAIATSGNGIAFLGEKGAGKSTFAAHMQKHGFPLITDDLIPVSFAEGGITTLPGFPRIRLWGDSLDSVGADPATSPKINKFVDKRSFHCGENFAIEPVTVDAIYVLTLDDDVSIELLKPSEAFIELTRNTYLNRYLHASGKHSDNFRGCEMIVRSVPIFRLRRPHDFDRLPEVASAVMDHIAQPQRHSSVRHARSSPGVLD